MSTLFGSVLPIGAVTLQRWDVAACAGVIGVGGSIGETDFFGDVVKRTALDLDENAADVLAYHREGNELKPAENHGRRKEASVTHRDVGSEDLLHDAKQPKTETERGHDCTDAADQAQRMR
jgi:hypothetical protein